MPSLRFLTALACLCLAPVVLAAETPPAELQGLDAYIGKSMADWKVPGLAIAVVKDDKLVWMRGFGHRNLDEPEAVDPNTLFAIGSNTKAFTVAALGTLVESGKLRWDDQVAALLPGFQMYDPYVTREVTLRDLLSHRSGTCGEDGVWYGTDFGTQDVISRLRYQKPAYSFRSQFCYSNSLYMAAGEVVTAETGIAWGNYVRSHFFQPLHMDSSNTSVHAFMRGADVAAPHAEVEGKVLPIAWFDGSSIEPAGAINSSVHDMSQWMRMLLADGVYEGRQILKPETIREMETPQMLIGGKEGEAQFLASLNPDSRFYAYGLGFFLQDYAGTEVVWHSGHIDGMSAGLGMVPSQHLGVVVLSNMDQSWLPMALVWRVIDAYTARPQKDWSTAILNTVVAVDAADKAAADDQEKAYRPGASPHPLADYAGTYSNDLYGDVVVSLDRGNLTLHMSKRFQGELRHWDYDTFQVRWDYAYLGKEYATFGSDAKGRPVSITLPGFATYLRVGQ